LIDAWWLFDGDYYPDWGPYTEFGRLRTRDAFEHAKRVVARLDRRNVAVFHIDDDVGCLKGFGDFYFDWVYLDSSHEYEHTKKELAVLKRKVRRGGLIAGDDWQPDPNHAHHGLCCTGVLSHVRVGAGPLRQLWAVVHQTTGGVVEAAPSP